jgi:uncharacterized membrane protein YeaQ/YmgE (transglycosylase-associated protein family)
MSCPGCGSTLWDGNKCGACGRQASDTTPRVGPARPSRANRVVMAALKGAVAGAVLGYLGGKPLNLPALENGIWIGAVTGAVVGLVVVVLLARFSRREASLALVLIPGLALAGAITIGFKKLVGWAFGWAVAQENQGYIAAVLGGVIGCLLAASIAFLMSRDRDVKKDAVPSN